MKCETWHAETWHAETWHAETWHGGTWHAEIWHRRWFAVSRALITALMAAGPASAQTPPKTPPLPPVPPPALASPAPARQNDLAPSYEPDLERLAQLIGTLAYLRDLCGKGDGAEWRARMTALIDAEAKTQDRRERLAGAYNRGFLGYQMTYHSCTPAAEVVIGRFLDEGERLTHDLTTRYGGG